MGKYEIRTMQNDIKELKKKMGAGAPEKLPIIPELPKPPKPKKKRRKILLPVIIVAMLLLIGAGLYYYLQGLKKPEPEIPAFLTGADEIEIIEPLEINIPTDVSNVLGKEYTFFVYSQNRAGFVVKVADREVDLQDWESTLKEDLMSIFLDQELGEPATEEFQDNIYKDINIRYLNFSDPSLTIDYAIVGNYLIITTSRESMYWVIDRVLEEPVAQEQEEVVNDCGSSDFCFSDYVKTCTPTKATITETQDGVELVYQETIEGFDDNDCILTLVYTKSPVSGFVGKEMTCRVP